MKTLFLTSQFKNMVKELKAVLPKPANELSCAFIPTAADVYEEKPWMYADRDELIKLGLNVFDLPLKGKTKQEIEEALSNVDIIFVAGGNTFYLLDEARKSGFVEIIPKLVEKGVIYIGSSAGSYLACPTIEAATWKNQDKNIIGMTDFTALNLVPFILFVHYKPEHNDLLKQEIPKTKYPVRILKDDQAILVLDNKYKFVGQSEEIKI